MRVTPRWLPPPRALQARPAPDDLLGAADVLPGLGARVGCVAGPDRLEDRDVELRELRRVPVRPVDRERGRDVDPSASQHSSSGTFPANSTTAR